MQHDEWILRCPGPPRRLRLYCFPYAGGSAFNFLPWQAALDSTIEVCAVQLPGRGERLTQEPYRTMPELIAALLPVFARPSEVPFAFFGHSLGGLLAFELARSLALHGLRMPIHLFASGSPAPRHRVASRQVHRLEDAALVQVLQEYNGTPPELLANRELLTLVLPMIRADFAVAETYQYRVGRLLDVPITVLAGKADECGSLEQVSGWQRETSGACRVLWFEGDHFFINSHRKGVLEALNAALLEAMRAQPVSAERMLK